MLQFCKSSFFVKNYICISTNLKESDCLWFLRQQSFMTNLEAWRGKWHFLGTTAALSGLGHSLMPAQAWTFRTRIWGGGGVEGPGSNPFPDSDFWSFTLPGPDSRRSCWGELRLKTGSSIPTRAMPFILGSYRQTSLFSHVKFL